MWSAIGEIIFTVVVGYMGAIELLFVAKQIYHLAFQHQGRQMLVADDRGLRELQERIDREIVEAAEKEILGYNAMKDGILYKDGFRIDPGEINDHERSHRELSGGSKSGRELSGDRTENIAKKTCETSSESEVRQEVIEEPCVKKVVTRIASPRPEVIETQADEDKQAIPTQTVKTQIGQTNLEEYAHPAAEATPVAVQTRTEGFEEAPQHQASPLRTDTHFDEYQREEPEGQDVPEPQYSDDYLRSLDGIKIRPLVRDDGTRRRRAFKKRHSSDSTSSRESRASREEELKMFTSLEEEEFESIRRGDSDYVPIKYSSDPNLLKAGKHQRRHKKSPIKEAKHAETEDTRGSLEMLDEENPSPWGDVKPEHYRDTEFWKREKAVSIEEESDENAPSLPGEDIEKQQAGQLIASSPPIKNIPKFSSFEEATHSQHEDAVSTITKQKPKDEAKKSSEKDVEKVSSTPTQYDAGLQGVLIEQETSAGTEDTVACRETGDDTHHNAGLRKSPRIEDIDRYEERLCEEDENAKVRAILPSAQTPDNISMLESSQLTEPQIDVTQSGSEKLSPSPTREGLKNVSASKYENRPHTPVIEIIRAENTSEEPGSLLEGISDFYDFNASINPSRSPSREKSLRLPVSPTRSRSPSANIMEERDRSKIPFNTLDLSGLSSFYDFCVMMNQRAYGLQIQRAHSAHRSSTDYLAATLRAKNSRSKSPSLVVSAPKNGVASLPETGGGTNNYRSTPCTPDALEIDGGRKTHKRSLSPLVVPLPPEGLNISRSETTHYTPQSPLDTPLIPESLEHFKPMGNVFYTTSTPLETPETPDFQRSFSANMRYLEQMKDEYRTNAFKRSTYVGESMDFENDFEDLRERTRRFKRSRSKSRSPLLDDDMEPCTSSQAAQRELQDRILEEITRTTIHYQDFSRDMAQRFVDYDRRGSDSALLQKESIPIEDNLREKALQTDEDLLNELDGEDYHHFRRFSLNLESQEEEYPEDDNYAYMEKIDVQTESGIRSWTRQDFYDNDNSNSLESESIQESNTSVGITGTNSDHADADADDIDTESEDDRQTVVEVDDEIDEDVFDDERQEERSNEQSECEEAEREMDRYANKNANDWKDEGAIGGFSVPAERPEDESISIDQMYNDAVKNTEESGIEKDYDTIVEAMNEEERLSGNSTESKDVASVTTEALLDEILREDEKLNNHRSPRRDEIEVTANFINYEVSREIINKNSKTTSSTRLRSRYGLGPAIVHRDFDDLNDVNVDINYKPKKEYKWRKNFKLDDDDTPKSTEPTENQNYEEDFNSDTNADKLQNGQELETEGSEFLSRIDQNKSPKNSNHFVDLHEGNDESGTVCQKSEDSGICKGAIKKQKIVRNEIRATMSNNTEKSIPEEEELKPSRNDGLEKTPRKKKTKRRTRRGSKASLSYDEDGNEVPSPQNDENQELDTENISKRKPKRKKKVLEAISPPTPNEASAPFIQDTLKPLEGAKPTGTNLKSPSPPRPDALLNSTNLQPHTKSLSPTPAKTPPPASNSIMPNTQPLEKLPEASKTSVRLTATSSAAESKSKSKSRSPDPATASGHISTQPASSPRPQLERNDSSGVYELIKDGSMYPWF